jgi:hypothetical protein
VILAQTSRPAPVRCTEIVPDEGGILGLGPAVRCGETPSLNLSGGMERGVDALRGIASRTQDMRLRSKSVCVLELPAEVDADRSIAVLSNGLLAIRMPKINSCY